MNTTAQFTSMCPHVLQKLNITAYFSPAGNTKKGVFLHLKNERKKYQKNNFRNLRLL